MARVKIGTITTNWNTERFIVPHMKMITSLTDRNVVLQGTAPWPDYQRAHGISIEPDNSENLIKENFPKVEIVPARVNDFCADLYNQGLELLEDMDVVIKLDADMFLTKKDWIRLIKFIKNTGYDCYYLDWTKHVIDYAYDLDHGLRNAIEYEPLAVSPKKRFYNYVDYPSTGRQEIDVEITIHHLRGWKGKGNSLDWVNSQKVEWLKAPRQVKRMIYGK